jgi:DNA-binding HxlR family transcriptional regulator
MRRKSLSGAACPIARSLEIIGDWWSLLIVRDATLGRRRFGEFQRSLGLSKNILTVRLRNLVDNGILEMVPASDGTAYHDYVLTPRGRDLATVLVALRQWGEKHQFAGEQCGTVLVDRLHERPVRPLELHAADGRQLEIGETIVKPAPRRRASR